MRWLGKKEYGRAKFQSLPICDVFTVSYLPGTSLGLLSGVIQKIFFSKTGHVQVSSADQTTNLRGKDLRPFRLSPFHFKSTIHFNKIFNLLCIFLRSSHKYFLYHWTLFQTASQQMFIEVRETSKEVY